MTTNVEPAPEGSLGIGTTYYGQWYHHSKTLLTPAMVEQRCEPFVITIPVKALSATYSTASDTASASKMDNGRVCSDKFAQSMFLQREWLACIQACTANKEGMSTSSVLKFYSRTTPQYVQLAVISDSDMYYAQEFVKQKGNKYISRTDIAQSKQGNTEYITMNKRELEEARIKYRADMEERRRLLANDTAEDTVKANAINPRRPPDDESLPDYGCIINEMHAYRLVSNAKHFSTGEKMHLGTKKNRFLYPYKHNVKPTETHIMGKEGNPDRRLYTVYETMGQYRAAFVEYCMDGRPGNPSLSRTSTSMHSMLCHTTQKAIKKYADWLVSTGYVTHEGYKKPLADDDDFNMDGGGDDMPEDDSYEVLMQHLDHTRSIEGCEWYEHDIESLMHIHVLHLHENPIGMKGLVITDPISIGETALSNTNPAVHTAFSLCSDASMVESIQALKVAPRPSVFAQTKNIRQRYCYPKAEISAISNAYGEGMLRERAKRDIDIRGVLKSCNMLPYSQEDGLHSRLIHSYHEHDSPMFPAARRVDVATDVETNCLDYLVDGEWKRLPSKPRKSSSVDEHMGWNRQIMRNNTSFVARVEQLVRLTISERVPYSLAHHILDSVAFCVMVQHVIHGLRQACSNMIMLQPRSNANVCRYVNAITDTFNATSLLKCYHTAGPFKSGTKNMKNKIRSTKKSSTKRKYSKTDTISTSDILGIIGASAEENNMLLDPDTLEQIGRHDMCNAPSGMLFTINGSLRRQDRRCTLTYTLSFWDFLAFSSSGENLIPGTWFLNQIFNQMGNASQVTCFEAGGPDRGKSRTIDNCVRICGIDVYISNQPTLKAWLESPDLSHGKVTVFDDIHPYLFVNTDSGVTAPVNKSGSGQVFAPERGYNPTVDGAKITHSRMKNGGEVQTTPTPTNTCSFSIGNKLTCLAMSTRTRAIAKQMPKPSTINLSLAGGSICKTVKKSAGESTTIKNYKNIRDMTVVMINTSITQAIPSVNYRLSLYMMTYCIKQTQITQRHAYDASYGMWGCDLLARSDIRLLNILTAATMGRLAHLVATAEHTNINGDPVLETPHLSLLIRMEALTRHFQTNIIDVMRVIYNTLPMIMSTEYLYVVAAMRQEQTQLEKYTLCSPKEIPGKKPSIYNKMTPFLPPTEKYADDYFCVAPDKVQNANGVADIGMFDEGNTNKGTHELLRVGLLPKNSDMVATKTGYTSTAVGDMVTQDTSDSSSSTASTTDKMRKSGRDAMNDGVQRPKALIAKRLYMQMTPSYEMCPALNQLQVVVHTVLANLVLCKRAARKEINPRFSAMPLADIVREAHARTQKQCLPTIEQVLDIEGPMPYTTRVLEGISVPGEFFVEKSPHHRRMATTLTSMLGVVHEPHDHDHDQLTEAVTLIMSTSCDSVWVGLAADKRDVVVENLRTMLEVPLNERQVGDDWNTKDDDGDSIYGAESKAAQRLLTYLVTAYKYRLMPYGLGWFALAYDGLVAPQIPTGYNIDGEEKKKKKEGASESPPDRERRHIDGSYCHQGGHCMFDEPLYHDVTKSTSTDNKEPHNVGYITLCDVVRTAFENAIMDHMDYLCEIPPDYVADGDGDDHLTRSALKLHTSASRKSQERIDTANERDREINLIDPPSKTNRHYIVDTVSVRKYDESRRLEETRAENLSFKKPSRHDSSKTAVAEDTEGIVPSNDTDDDASRTMQCDTASATNGVFVKHDHATDSTAGKGNFAHITEIKNNLLEQDADMWDGDDDAVMLAALDTPPGSPIQEKEEESTKVAVMSPKKRRELIRQKSMELAAPDMRFGLKAQDSQSQAAWHDHMMMMDEDEEAEYEREREMMNYNPYHGYVEVDHMDVDTYMPDVRDEVVQPVVEKPVVVTLSPAAPTRSEEVATTEMYQDMTTSEKGDTIATQRTRVRSGPNPSCVEGIGLSRYGMERLYHSVDPIDYPNMMYIGMSELSLTHDGIVNLLSIASPDLRPEHIIQLNNANIQGRCDKYTKGRIPECHMLFENQRLSCHKSESIHAVSYQRLQRSLLLSSDCIAIQTRIQSRATEVLMPNADVIWSAAHERQVMVVQGDPRACKKDLLQAGNHSWKVEHRVPAFYNLEHEKQDEYYILSDRKITAKERAILTMPTLTGDMGKTIKQHDEKHIKTAEYKDGIPRLYEPLHDNWDRIQTTVYHRLGHQYIPDDSHRIVEVEIAADRKHTVTVQDGVQEDFEHRTALFPTQEEPSHNSSKRKNKKNKKNKDIPKGYHHMSNETLDHIEEAATEHVLGAADYDGILEDADMGFGAENTSYVPLPVHPPHDDMDEHNSKRRCQMDNINRMAESMRADGPTVDMDQYHRQNLDDCASESSYMSGASRATAKRRQIAKHASGHGLPANLMNGVTPAAIALMEHEANRPLDIHQSRAEARASGVKLNKKKERTIKRTFTSWQITRSNLIKNREKEMALEAAACEDADEDAMMAAITEEAQAMDINDADDTSTKDMFEATQSEPLSYDESSYVESPTM